MGKLTNIHPVEILNKEFLMPMEISANRWVKEAFTPQTRVYEFDKGTRITADTALRLFKFFGTSPKF